MTAARTLASLLNGTVTFGGEVIVNTPVNPNDAVSKSYVDNAAGSNIVPLDDLSGKFDGIESRFLPTSAGVTVPITNPFRLLVTVNGILQSVYTPEYVWQSPLPRTGFQVDNGGYLSFSEVPPAGSAFNGRVMLGPTTNSTTNTNYPFKATDILLGA
jgi:hypothetical protein